jgi:hypothetical protein
MSTVTGSGKWILQMMFARAVMNYISHTSSCSTWLWGVVLPLEVPVVAQQEHPVAAVVLVLAVQEAPAVVDAQLEDLKILLLPFQQSC